MFRRQRSWIASDATQLRRSTGIVVSLIASEIGDPKTLHIAAQSKPVWGIAAWPAEMDSRRAMVGLSVRLCCPMRIYLSATCVRGLHLPGFLLRRSLETLTHSFHPNSRRRKQKDLEKENDN
jgi:hypothetical protein